MIELRASVLAANHAYIARDLLEAERCGINHFHFDVSDGHFTRYILFGSQMIHDLKTVSSSYFDVHLAVNNMESILETFIETDAECLNLQYESAGEALQRMIDRIHECKREVSLTCVPETPFKHIEPLLERVDTVNFLAVHPGIGGQMFDASVLKKIEIAAGYIMRHSLPTRISVDGGINDKTLTPVQSAGADIAIIGSAIFCGVIEENVRKLRSLTV